MNKPPLLLLDIDGVLNPYGASRRWLDRSPYRKHSITVTRGDTYPVWLDRGHGKVLLDLVEETGTELVWATTWEHEANVRVGPKIGLPELPVVEFGHYLHTLEWKFGPVLRYAGDRPLAWFDDDFAYNRVPRDWFLQKRGDRPTLLVDVEPHLGLVEANLDAVRTWAKTLSAEPAEIQESA